MSRTPDTWIADGYDVKQRGGRMIAYCGPHHTPAHEYPQSCRLQDEENAQWIAAAPARIAALEGALENLVAQCKSGGAITARWKAAVDRAEFVLANEPISRTTGTSNTSR